MMKTIEYLKRTLIPSTIDKIDSPILVNFPITDNCNSKCIMCNVWKDRVKDEITQEQLESALKLDYFKNVKHLGISGGEPTLRKDLVECVKTVVNNIKTLESLSITSHGFHFNRWERMAPKIKASCEAANVSLSVNISIDGNEETHDKVRGTEGAYKRALKTIKLLKENSIPVQIQCTVSKENLYTINDVLSLAQELDVDCIYRCATGINRLYNGDIIQDIALSKDQKSFLADFFLSDILHQSTKSISRGLYYESIAKHIEGDTKRDMPCYFQREGCLLSSKGEISPCSVSTEVIGNVLDETKDKLLSEYDIKARKNTLNNQCSSCIHDQSGAWPIASIASYLVRRRLPKLNKILSITSKLALASTKLIYLTFKGKNRLEKEINADSVRQILVIGAYGGEHVGDAAILGGVILRCLKRYKNLEEVYISSFRKDRTERWVNSLELPITMKCIDDNDAFKAKIDVDLVVYGGGPLMELPLHLLNHLYVVTKYAGKGVPFSLEGVGIGPIKTKVSELLIAKLINLSAYTRVRTNKAKYDAKELSNKDVDLGCDPAFDYIEYRSEPNKVSQSEKDSIQTVLSNSENKLIVAINLRPLWSKYSYGNAVNIAEVENRYISEMASCFKILSEKYDVEFVFFPMNADQFGMSDFLTANLLKLKLEENGIKLKVWREEPGVDAVISFLRKVDCVISMRFHGCIFALSQNNENVISIDYQIGKDGKVSDVMNDSGASEYKTRVDKLTADDLFQKVESIFKFTVSLEKSCSTASFSIPTKVEK